MLILNAMKKRIKDLLFLFFFVPFFSFSQKETNNWYFGYGAGLNFSTGEAAPVHNGQLNSAEGTACISDKVSGRLLFYTDGQTVWDSTHGVMSNGTGLLGSGADLTSTQSSVIVPKPGSTSVYYIFTIGPQGGNVVPPVFGGMAYSTVDMSLNSGLGAVTIKNTLLVDPTAEKITAIKHKNCTDFWVITHQLKTDSFYVYLVTNAGVSTIPVISEVGSTWVEFRGNVIISPNGKKIASTTYTFQTELFDFNAQTGVVSNALTLATASLGADNNWNVAFSPDNSKLYTTDFGDINQYDLSSSNIPASKFVLPAVPGQLTFSMQLAKNGKIYLGELDYISVINYPDKLGGACDFVHNAISLEGDTSDLALPNFVSTFLNSSYSDFSTPSEACVGQPVLFMNASTGSPDVWAWNFGDNTSTGSALQDTAYTYNSPGTYTVTMSGSKACQVDNVMKKIITVTNCADTLPNVFTPNGDGKNDVFVVNGNNTQKMDCKIYDRWGKEVNVSLDVNVNWNGTTLNGDKVSDGVYYYVINALSTTGEEIKKNGFITLLGK